MSSSREALSALPPAAAEILAWVSFAALLVAVVCCAGWAETATAQLLATVSMLVVVGHAVRALGWRDAFTFAATCLVVTFTVENIGQATGFPFGHYRFLVGADLPHVGTIPIIVGPLYFGLGYPAWVIAWLLLTGDPPRRPSGREIFTLPIVAALVETAWDVATDPTNSTLAGLWRWSDGGSYFGVPWTNFAGWLFVTWLYLQSVAIMFARRRTGPPYVRRSRSFWAVPVLLYLSAGLCQILPWIDDPDAVLRDAAGRIWSARTLRESAVVAVVATMVPIALLALLRLNRSRQGRPFAF